MTTEELGCPFCKANESRFWCIDWQGNEYVQCVKCTALHLRYPIFHEYDDSYWVNTTDPDGNSRDITKERDFKVRNWYGDIIDYVNNLPGGRVLDYGCGLGFLLSALDDKWSKVGYDVSKEGLEFTSQNFPEVKTVNSTEELKLEEKFDVVISYHVIEHVDDPGVLIDELTSYLSEDGVLIIGTPNSDSFCSRRFKGNFRLLGNGHICLMGPHHLRELFKDKNYDVVKEEYPFLKTTYFTFKNLLRLINRKRVSPPFYGSIMTFYGKRIADKQE